MLYFRTFQFIPMKGNATMLYETTEDYSVIRSCTYIPETKELQKFEKPVIKKLFRPEMLEEITQVEFDEIWNKI